MQRLNRSGGFYNRNYGIVETVSSVICNELTGVSHQGVRVSQFLDNDTLIYKHRGPNQGESNIASLFKINERIQTCSCQLYSM